MYPQEQNKVKALLNTVIIEGRTYLQEQPFFEVEFAANSLIQDAFAVRAVEDTKAQHLEVEVLGAFYRKPNFLFHCSHI